MLFLIVEYPDTTFGAFFTAKRRGVTLDSITEPAIGPPHDRRHPGLTLAQGLKPEDERILVTGLTHLYEDLQTLQSEPRRGRWLGRCSIRERVLLGTAMHRLLHLQDRVGSVWTHVESGMVHLRARVADPKDGERLAAEVRQALQAGGVEGQVELRELGPKDYGVWEELVQHAIGLAQ